VSCEIFPAANVADAERVPHNSRLFLEGDGYYWHLYPYFQSAKIPSEDPELIDLFSNNVIDGYELDRLQLRLEDARMDIQWRPDQWTVTTGWRGGNIAKETEILCTVEKRKLNQLINQLLEMIENTKKMHYDYMCAVMKG
jgi:hypothetical protein